MRRPAWLVLPAGLLAACLLVAADAPPPAYQADVKPASPEAELRLTKFRVPAGLRAELWAAEPMVANIVAFAFDGRGRCYVAETFRHSDGVTDIRGHMDWLDDDLACRTVQDRFNLYKKHLGAKLDTYAVHHDRVRLVEDTKGGGKADKATVFADGFHSHVTGIGAGVLARQGKVWYTCIPDLWLLQDTDGDGRADVRKSLSTGYGVHTGFIGHDLHGLRMGPDGKLYFSIGDRGLNVTTPDGRHLVNPDSGAVLRCNPDGSELEIVATGLRNPQELAFNEFGDLFTCDNNSDSGDKARWVHVVEGGDSGWRFGYQFMEGDYRRGPFNAEKLWYPAFDGQAAYIVPPLFNIADGPSGLTYDPGTGLPEAYRGRFFLCDFRGGNSGTSGVRSVKLKPKGASFELAEQTEFFWGVLATDCDFGPDGALYVSDWHEGWNKPGKGRLYRLVNPEYQGSALQKEVQKLLADDLTKRPVEELVKLLGHADQRVRQEAQFALVSKGGNSIVRLGEIAAKGPNWLARLHAIWALGELLKEYQTPPYDLLEPLLTDADPEVRAQTIRVFGWSRWPFTPRGEWAALLKDPNPRVRFQAAITISRERPSKQPHDLQEKAATAALVRAMIAENNDRDPYLRHAGVMALAASLNAGSLAKLIEDKQPAVRVAAVLALRRQHSPEASRFLNDPDSGIVLEAARAIYDVPIPDAMDKLAARITRPDLPEPLGRRVLAANFRLGTPESAAALARFAARRDEPEVLCGVALTLLGQWAKPSGRDPVVGLWRPVEPRPAGVAVAAIQPALADLFAGPDLIREKAAALVGELGIRDAAPHLSALFQDTKRSARARVEALKALAALQAPGWAEAVEKGVTDVAEPVRVAAYGLVAKLDPKLSLALLEKALDGGSVRERQAAVTTLGGMRGRDADAVLVRLLDRLLAGQVPPEVQLDLLNAAEKRRSPQVRQKLEQYQARLSKDDPLAPYRVALVGGHAESGKNVFFEKAEVACLRCHKVGDDGGEVGPNLTHIGKEKSREYLLESMVDPNKQIAKGFETVILNLTDGRRLAGVVKEEDARHLTLITPEAQTVTVMKDQIAERDTGPSSMPADIKEHLTKSELRDLVEFLASQK
jgi:quinoprotein glucose dehydrogenase